MQEAEPKGTDFLLPTEIRNNPPSTNQVKLTVRSDEARQSSQVGGDFYLERLKGFAQQMKLNPTFPEKLLSDFLTQYSIPFKTQKVICPYIVDFLLIEKGLVIEIDGQHHTQNINQMSYDTKRDELLMSLKLTLIRFNNKDIKDKLNTIIEIYSKRPNFNTDKINFRIAHHNHHFQEKGFDTETGSYLKKYFARYLKTQLKNIVRKYKFDLTHGQAVFARPFLKR